MIHKDADFSSDRIHRYSLSRFWISSKPKVAFVGLNPSTADENIDDPTVRRCIRFADSWGFGGMYMLNIFAFRATDPKEMKAAADPVGFLNNEFLERISSECEITVAAWGTHGNFKGRDQEVLPLLNNLHYLAKTKHGFPKHPLYLKKSLQPIKWNL